MSNASPVITIPDDLQGCQALVEQLVGTINLQTNTIDELNREKQELKLAFAALLQQAFRRRSERYLANPNQMKLDFGDSDDVSDAAEGLAEAVQEQTVKEHTRRRKPRNEKLPEHLPRYEVEAKASDAQKQCDEHGERKVIGYDRVETLELERPKLRVRVTKYPKFACENHPQCGIGSPERPTGLVEGSGQGADRKGRGRLLEVPVQFLRPALKEPAGITQGEVAFGDPGIPAENLEEQLLRARLESRHLRGRARNLEAIGLGEGLPRDGGGQRLEVHGSTEQTEQ